MRTWDGVGQRAIEGAGFGAGIGMTSGNPIVAMGMTAAGTLIGTVTGLVEGAIDGSAAKSDDTLRNAVNGLAEALATGEVEASYDAMKEELEKRGVSEKEAAAMALEFSQNLDSLTHYGESVHAAELQQQAAFDSIASSAQELANTLDMTSE